MVRLFLFMLIFASPVFAQEGADDLMMQAVAYSAVVDANNAHCEKSSDLAGQYIQKFKALGTEPEARLRAFQALRDLQYEKTMTSLRAEAADCEDMMFKLSHLQLVRQLRVLSYRLNGVAEADIPSDNIPELEHFLPPKPQGLP